MEILFSLFSLYTHDIIMLDSSDIQTFYSLRELYEVIKDGEKPIVFWIGAGTSKWCGFPLWYELAENFHSNFLKTESDYNKQTAADLIETQSFPDFFQYCKDINPQKYNRLLTNFLSPKSVTPVYSRFLDNLRAISPLYIITTNVDEMLENNLEGITTVQNADLERCLSLLEKEQSFICKLHGSTSTIESMIFTTDDYKSLTENEGYLELLRYIFTQCSIVFIGFGLGDAYLNNLLRQVEKVKIVFGNGPHFAIVPSEREIPEFIKPVRYVPLPHKDHRSAIQVIDEIRIAKSSPEINVLGNFKVSEPSLLKSAHLISDILAPGTTRTSESANLSSGGATIIGNGLTTEELPTTITTSMHDLLVGLLCFDTIYASITALEHIHQLLGGDVTAELVQSDVLKFIYWERFECIFFEDQNNLDYGELLTMSVANGLLQADIDRLIRAQISAMPGREKEAEKTFATIKNKTTIIDHEIEPSIGLLTNGALLRQSIRELIGMSGGMSLKLFPKWMQYPVLRLANVIKIGSACNILGIASTKLEFGSAKLAGPAFAASRGNEWADSTASFILTGQFNTDLGALALANRSILPAIIKFRETASGIELRKEIFQQLSLREGSDFVTSINAGMRQAVSTRTWQAARNQITGLLVADKNSISELTPAIWNNLEYSNIALSLWKKRSLKILMEHCGRNKISQYKLCPCNSGEKLKFCCEESLAK